GEDRIRTTITNPHHKEPDPEPAEMSDCETAPTLEAPVPSACAAIKADLDKWLDTLQYHGVSLPQSHSLRVTPSESLPQCHSLSVTPSEYHGVTSSVTPSEYHGVTPSESLPQSITVSLPQCHALRVSRCHFLSHSLRVSRCHSLRVTPSESLPQCHSLRVSRVAEKGAEGCKDLMEAFAACICWQEIPEAVFRPESAERSLKGKAAEEKSVPCVKRETHFPRKRVFMAFQGGRFEDQMKIRESQRHGRKKGGFIQERIVVSGTRIHHRAEC
ncbi:putative glycoside hydrolase 22789, partial [Dissostichus eleginoides]